MRFYGELPARQHMAILRAILRKDPRTRPPAHARAHHRGPEEIAILPYASAGICSIASACDFSERPKVVLGEFEFPTMGHAWLAQQGRGPQVEFVRAGGEAIPFSSYERSIDRHTRITAVTHVCFNNGHWSGQGNCQ